MKRTYTQLTANYDFSIIDTYKQLTNLNIPIIKMNQTHSDIITIIDDFPKKQLTTIQNTDGLITTQKNIALTVKFADCMPIIISTKSLLCLLHSGRKGTQQHILKKALIRIKRLINSDQNLTIWFGPHICSNCYEINPDTYATYSMLDNNINQLKSELDLSKNNLIINTECTNTSKSFASYRGNNHTRKRNFITCYLN